MMAVHKSGASGKSERIRTLLREQGYDHLEKYLFRNHFLQYNVYYCEGEQNASFILPSAILVQNESQYSIRIPVIDEYPWVESAGELGISAIIDGEREDYSARSINELFKKGEENIYISDIEGVFVPADFERIEKNFSLNDRSVFRELVNQYCLYPSGVMTTRFLSGLNYDGIKHLNRRILGCSDEMNFIKIQKEILSVIQKKVRSSNPVADRFCIKMGLFNYGDGRVNYTRSLGRGEHIVYFEFLLGNPIGLFTPLSFIEIVSDGALSKRIYNSLVSAGILNGRGYLVKRTGREVHDILDFLGNERQRDMIAGLINAASPVSMDDVLADMERNAPVIESDLKKAQFHGSGHPVEITGMRKMIEQFSEGERKQYLELYQRFKIDGDVSRESVKNRGIVMMDDSGAIMIFLTDSIHENSPHYSMLVEYFSELYPESESIRIAHTYYRPFVRNPGEHLHPAVAAAQRLCNAGS